MSVSIHSECLLFDLRMVRALLREHSTTLHCDDCVEGALVILNGTIGVIEDASQLFSASNGVASAKVHLGPC